MCVGMLYRVQEQPRKMRQIFLCECVCTCVFVSRHLEKPDNAAFLQYAGKSGDPKLKNMNDELTAGGLTLACPCCHKLFSRSMFSSDFKTHIKAAKNLACLKVASKSKDPVVLEIYNKTLPR